MLIQNEKTLKINNVKNNPDRRPGKRGLQRSIKNPEGFQKFLELELDKNSDGYKKTASLMNSAINEIRGIK